MLKIRLSRFGKKNQPHYRIIVTEKRSKRDGSFVANLGHYINYSDPAIVKLDIEEYDKWLAKGAQPSDTVKYLRGLAKDSNETEIPKKDKGRVSKKKKEAMKAQKEESQPKAEAQDEKPESEESSKEAE